MKVTTIAATKPDGKASAQELLRTLEKLNWKRDAPVGSRNAMKAAFRAAVALPDNEFGRFVDVLALPLICHVSGSSMEYSPGHAKECFPKGRAA